MAPLGLPVLPFEKMNAYTKLLTAGHRDANVMAGHYADMQGWPTLVENVVRAWRALPAADRQRCTLLAGNYGEASALNVLGRHAGLSETFSGHNSYFLWGPPPADADICLAVAIPEASLGRVFRKVEVIGQIQLEYSAYYESDLTLLLGRDRIQSWQDAWPQFRSYR